MFKLKKIGMVMEMLSLINCAVRIAAFAYCLTIYPVHQAEPANPTGLAQAVEEMKAECADAISTHQSTTRRRQPEEATHSEWFFFFIESLKSTTKKKKSLYRDFSQAFST